MYCRDFLRTHCAFYTVRCWVLFSWKFLSDNNINQSGVITMSLEYFNLFNKCKLTPARDSCGLCDPDKSKDGATRICSYCTQTLISIRPSVWEHLLTYSINQGFPAWFITFCGDRADYYKNKKRITVKVARYSAKLTQQQLAELICVPVRKIQRWEASDKLASMQVLKACSWKAL